MAQSYLFHDEVYVNEKVAIIQPTVETVVTIEDYNALSQVMCISTRELFSGAPREVDHIEEQFPTIFDMIFNQEMSQFVGEMYGATNVYELLIDSISFWTKLNKNDFELLTNGKKIVHEKTDWVIDKEEFVKISDIVKKLTGYHPNEDLIAPKGISSSSERKISIFEKTYKGRLRKMQKQSTSFDQKVITIQISNGGYIPIDEIEKMSIYHFNKLYEAITYKEIYKSQWDVYVSSKFMPSEGSKSSAPSHWTTQFKI